VVLMVSPLGGTAKTMEGDAPGIELLSQLARSSHLADRAFAANALAFRQRSQDREGVAAVQTLIRETARREHAAVRARIRDRNFDRSDLLAELQRQPLELRDHLIEEILDIAYPPLEELALPPDLTPYSPSGLGEILFALDHSGLTRGKTLVDLGSGLGKVVLLAALLTGADAYGIEIDPQLVARSAEAANSLGLHSARFVQGDMRDAPLPPADAYYLFIPLQRSTDVVARLAPLATDRKIRVFSQPLDETRLPFLRASGASSYWLTMYESSPAGPEEQA
jgi:SAM-dependent methyltransferase